MRRTAKAAVATSLLLIGASWHVAARGCGDPADGANPVVPHVVSFSGVVAAKTSRSMRIGAHKVVLPSDPNALVLADGSCATPISGSDPTDPATIVGLHDDVAVGEEAEIAGSLQTDGTILAYGVRRRDSSVPPHQGPFDAGESAGTWSGICEASDADSFTVAGRRFWVHYGDGSYFDDDVRVGGADTPRPVQAGDAAWIYYLDWGADGWFAQGVVVRQTGEGTRLTGELVAEDDGRLSIGGLRFNVDDSTQIFPPGASEPNPDFFADQSVVESVAGLHGEVVGILRDGELFADRFVVTDTTRRDVEKKARRPSGRLVIHGAASTVGTRRAVVNGLPVALPDSSVPDLPAGTHVRVGARVAAGRVRATSFRRE